MPTAHTGEHGYAGLSPVDVFPANGYGPHDMAGNVWNWCSDLYAEDIHAREAARGAISRDPTGPEKTYSPRNRLAVERVTKGGSFLCSPSYCESYRPTARRGTPPDTGTGHIGFRRAMSAAAWRAKQTSAPAAGPRPLPRSSHASPS